jgi:hypothetical protein
VVVEDQDPRGHATTAAGRACCGKAEPVGAPTARGLDHEQRPAADPVGELDRAVLLADQGDGDVQPEPGVRPGRLGEVGGGIGEDRPADLTGDAGAVILDEQPDAAPGGAHLHADLAAGRVAPGRWPAGS